MKKLLASITLAAASLMAATPAAFAQTTVITDTTPVTFTSVVNGVFSNSYELTLPESTSGLLFGGGYSLSFAPNSTFGNIADFTISLAQDVGGSWVTALTQPVLASAAGFGISLGSLTAGDYKLTFAGTAPAVGQGTGFYSAALTVSPVPEPESYAMMLAGLAVMGAIARKRSQNKV
jgi:hypothetical protein